MILVISDFTKEKGGIHAINRSIMDAFGYYRVTGLLQKISAGVKARGHFTAVRWLFNSILTLKKQPPDIPESIIQQNTYHHHERLRNYSYQYYHFPILRNNRCPVPIIYFSFVMYIYQFHSQVLPSSSENAWLHTGLQGSVLSHLNFTTISLP